LKGTGGTQLQFDTLLLATSQQSSGFDSLDRRIVRCATDIHNGVAITGVMLLKTIMQKHGEDLLEKR
jgi:hypothetical protein